MSEYRQFIEDGKKYKLGEKEYPIKEVTNGKKLIDWRKRIFSEDTTDVLERMKRGEELTKEILETALDGFNYDTALEEFHPTELEGAAGDLFTFLYLKRPQREMSLLSLRLKENQSTPSS
jgi:hypothetical protein